MTNQQGAQEALYASAMEFAAEKASISYVQRKCRCSWNDAEQMLERMVREGIIATYNGQKSTALVEAQQPATHVQNPSEIEHVAGDVSKNGTESNMAQQPAPSAAVASKAVLAAIRAANLQLVRTGDDEFMLVTLKQATPQADSQPVMTPETVYAAIAHGDQDHRAWLLSALRAVWCGEAVPPVASPIANAAAESQPAPVEVADAMADSQYLAGVSAGWNAAMEQDAPVFFSTPYPELNAILEQVYRHRGADGRGSLRQLSEAVDKLVEKWAAASAPADSVTAPAGGAVMEPTPVTDADVRDMSARVISGQAEEDELVAFFERLVPPRPVRITHEADSVLEDAARLDWLALAGPTSICLVIDRPHDGEIEVATDDVIGYGKTLREAIDAAMKKGGAA